MAYTSHERLLPLAPRPRVECPILPPALGIIPQEIESCICKPIPKDRYHASIANLTHPAATFRAITRENPHLTWIDYLDSLGELINELSTLPTNHIETIGEEFALVGRSKRLLVASLARTGDIIDLHRKVFTQIAEHLKRVGITELGPFMAKTYDLRYFHPERFLPHITLARNYQGRKLPEYNIKGAKFRLQPPRLICLPNDSEAIPNKNGKTPYG